MSLDLSDKLWPILVVIKEIPSTLKYIYLTSCSPWSY